MFHKEYIDLSDDLICVGGKPAKGVLASKIGSALLKHLAKYPDVLSEDKSEVLNAFDTPQRDDL